MFLNLLKMIVRRCLKKGFMKLLVTGLLIMTVTFFLEKAQFEEVYVLEDLNFVGSDKPKSASYWKSITSSTHELPKSKIDPKKPSSVSNCGYYHHCPKTKKDFVNIHLVPHSHHDPGYKKTMDEYFYGLRNDIQNVTISKIISNVIHQLTLNKDRRFVYVEVVYFRKWWLLQTETTRETVRWLVQNGQFEFVNGGWCINDEATTNYADIIDQMSLGLSFLNETFGNCGRPKVAAQLDTFGHSREHATNIDKLIKHVNKRQKNGSPFNIFYSTPACYVKALNEANVTWPTKKDDFFPYHPASYWAGYFTSRPTLKYMVRQGSSLLQACKQMASVLKLKGAKYEGDISVMKEAMAVLQHHDGITGTHSQRVNANYVQILHKGVKECTKTLNSYYQEMSRSEEAEDMKFSVSYCHQLNISQCEATEHAGNRFIVNVYNSLGQFINKYVRVPVSPDFAKFRVIGSDGKILPSQLMPIASFVASIPERNSSAKYELIFLAAQVPPLGSKSFYIEAYSIENNSIPVNMWNSSNNPTISNEKLSVVVSKETGLITSLTILGKKKIHLDQQFFWYNCNRGQNTTESGSGVYTFNPLYNGTVPIKMETNNVIVYKGELVEEIHQKVNDYIGQIIRLYRGLDYIELDWVIGPVPIEDEIGKEVITRYTTNFKNNGTFYTDSNGRQSIKRTTNKGQMAPVASNYYPITSHVYMTDSKSGYRMNVLTDRAQGGGSVEDGQLEFLIHRRHVQQDLYLFKEPLDEMSHGKGLVVRGTHTLFFEDVKRGMKLGSLTLRSLVQERNREPIISFIITNYTSDQWIKFNRSKLQFLAGPLPENVKLLTLEPIPGQEREYILRLEHIYDVGEHSILSSPIEVSIKELFKDFGIKEMVETTLDGNLVKSALAKLKWKSSDIQDVDATLKHNTSLSLDHIKIGPMEIRTFKIRLNLSLTFLTNKND